MGRVPLILGFFVLLALMAVRLWDPVPVQSLRLAYFDGLQRIAPRSYEPVGVRIVDIDDASLEAVGQWPWPRDILADLVYRLDAYGAKVVALDLILSEPDQYSPSTFVERGTFGAVHLPETVRAQFRTMNFDTDFADSLTVMPVILGVAQRAGDGDSAPAKSVEITEFGTGLVDALPLLGPTTSVLPTFEGVAAGVGSLAVNAESRAAVVRTVPLAWRSDGRAVPSLAVEALRIGLDRASISLKGDSGSPGTIRTLQVGGDKITIPTRADGGIWVRFRPREDDMYVSAKDVLASGALDPALQQKLEGHTVFVGTSAAGRFNVRTTALGEALPGVAIHAQVAEQILLGTYLTRAVWVDGAEMAALLVLGLLIGYRMFRSGPIMSFAMGFAGAVVIAVTSWLAFTQYNLLLDASFPLIGGFFGFAFVTGYQFIAADRDKREMRRSFSRYVAPTVLEQIEGSGYVLELGGEMRPATVMFCDIRDFTPISEQYSAEELVRFLNELFGCLSAEILKTQGTIDKFIGDSVMAFWNAPLPVDDYPERAMEAALAMRQALKRFNKNRDEAPVRLAIGLSTGQVCVGNIGSADRFDYSVIGDNVNVAARLEAACRWVGCDVLVTDQTYREADRFACLYAGALKLKGVSSLTPAWVMCGDGKLKGSYVYKNLATAHNAWQAGVRRKASAAELSDLLTRCREAAKAVSDDMVTFVDALDGRLEDYKEPPAIDKTGVPKPPRKASEARFEAIAASAK